MRNETAWQNKTAWKLYKENWKLCHEIVTLRDGYVCQIPGCGITECLDLDHVFSRECKILFFDTDGLGYLCGPHHTHKSFRRGQWVAKTVDDICRIRAGEAWWEDAKVFSKQTCGKFRTTGYQEEMNFKLKQELETLKRGKNEKIESVNHHAINRG